MNGQPGQRTVGTGSSQSETSNSFAVETGTTKMDADTFAAVTVVLDSTTYYFI